MFDDRTLSMSVSARLDLPMSKHIMEHKNIDRCIVEQCWYDQLRYKRKNKKRYVDLMLL